MYFPCYVLSALGGHNISSVWGHSVNNRRVGYFLPIPHEPQYTYCEEMKRKCETKAKEISVDNNYLGLIKNDSF